MNQSVPFKKSILLAALPSLLFFSCAIDTARKTNATFVRSDTVIAGTTVVAIEQPLSKSKKKIKIALLLDTSSSMDGLINQAREQLWRLVNELSLAKCDNEKPDLEIALYEYGNDLLSSQEGYIRQVCSFTSDLDLVSEKLFGLTTKGGAEFCGYVIASATKQLEWMKESKDLQLIFIAGNESFYQGRINSTESCNNARGKDIVINTIFCGDYSEGINMGWKNGALLTEGNYMAIEQNKKRIYIETPFDNEIAQLNDKLNNTYVNYGSLGDGKKANQLKQDKNAEIYGRSNTVNRVISKSGKFYSNSSWDLVDASKTKEFDLSRVKEAELPAELKGKTALEKQQFIKQKAKERDEVIKQIEMLNLQRIAFIAEKSKGAGADDSLDAAMIKSIREQAARKNFVFEL